MKDGTGKLLVVIPAWNEAASVGHVVEHVRGRGYDVLVVDDGSADATRVEAERHGAATVRLPVNLGVGAALRCGFVYAVQHGYDAVVQVDADGQHPVKDIDLLREEVGRTNAHLVTGSRFGGTAGGMKVGLLRRLVMTILARSASRATKTRITDATSGFRLIRQPLLGEFARSFPAHYLGDTYEALVGAGRAGYLVREVPVVMQERVHGRSSASRLAAVRFTLRASIVAAVGIEVRIAPLDLHSAGSARTPRG